MNGPIVLPFNLNAQEISHVSLTIDSDLLWTGPKVRHHLVDCLRVGSEHYAVVNVHEKYDGARIG